MFLIFHLSLLFFIPQFPSKRMQAAQLTQIDSHTPHVNNDIIQLFDVIRLTLHPNTTSICMTTHELMQHAKSPQCFPSLWLTRFAVKAGASTGGGLGVGARAGTAGRSCGICARGGRVRRPLDDRLRGLVRRPRPNVDPPRQLITNRRESG